MKTADIYLITNLITGKQYVGQTIKGYLNRFDKHCFYAKNPIKRKCPQLIDRVIATYGIENFKVELLETVDIKLKDEKEKYYIKLYNTLESGYNLTPGGDYNPMNDPDIRKRHKELMTSKKMIDKIKKSVNEAYTPKLKAWFSDHSKAIWEFWTEEQKLNCVRGFIAYNESKKQKVIMLDSDENIIKKFDSLSDACRYFNVPISNAGNIKRYCDKYNKSGKRSTYLGYKWTLNNK